MTGFDVKIFVLAAEHLVIQVSRIKVCDFFF